MDNKLSISKPGNDQNEAFLSLYHKANRLVAAVFMVIKLMEETDNLKSKIKDLNLQMLSLIAELMDAYDVGETKIFVTLEKRVLELISLLEVASMSGMISEMNSSILKSEFNLLMESVRMFSSQVEQSKEQKLKSVLPVSLAKVENIVLEKSYRDTELVKDVNKGHKRKDLRKTAILEFIKEHKNVSIKDILPNVKGCSEKTIQRELMALLSSGEIRKTGERRWSRYYIA